MSQQSIPELPMELVVHFVSCISDHGAFFRKRIQGMAGDEPSGFDVVFGEHFQ